MFSVLSKKYIVFVFILVVIGSFLRFYNLGEQSYWIDESITVLNVQSIQETGIARLYSGSYYTCPLYCYPTALIANIFGNSEVSYRFLAAVFGILFIPIIFLITRRMFGDKVALLTTIFTTFSYWQISWSRQARWYTLFECLFWLSIFCFYLAQSSKKKSLYWLTGILTLLTMVAHPLGYLLPVVFTLLYIVDQISTGIKWKQILIATLTLLGIFFICDVIFHVKLIKYIGNYLEFRWILPQNLNFFIRNYLLFFVFSFVGLFFTKKYNGKAIWLITTVFCSYFLFLSVFSRTLNYSHLFQVTPVLYILASVGIVAVIEKINIKWIKNTSYGIILVIFFTSQGGVLIPKTHYFVEADNPHEWPRFNMSYSIAPQPDWKSAYGFINSQKQTGEIVISSTPQFNKLYLNEPGYWLSFLPRNSNFERNGKDIYVGAQALHNASELKQITSKQHGYIVFDGYYGRSTYGSELISYIKTLDLLFYKETEHNSVWVYKF